MSRSINRTVLLGNVGSDPEVRMTPSGTKVAKFSLATSRQWKDASGTAQEKTDWHRCTVFSKLADIAERWVHKGDRLYVDGRIEYSTTEHEGVTRYWTDIIVQELVLISGGSGERVALPAAKPDDDPLPF